MVLENEEATRSVLATDAAKAQAESFRNRQMFFEEAMLCARVRLSF